MAQSFEEITRNVVDRFLQNILFIDDKAYQPENKENAFDAQKISSVFAKKGKLCTILEPHSPEDLKTSSSLFPKSDVVVLDWYLDLKNEKLIGNEEDDADVEEPRGVHTKSLIKKIVEDASDKKLKLIIIYTGDGTKLEDITNEIYNEIRTYGGYFLSEEDYRVSSSNVLILVRAKSNGEGEQYKYNGDLQDNVIEYDDLPDFITREFAKFIGGLLPNFALSAIASIRECTSNVLGVFSKDIDPAFLGDYVSIPDCNDAVSMLPKIFGTAVANLIETSDVDFDGWIKAWIDEKIKEDNQITIGKKRFTVNADNLKTFVTPNETFGNKLNTIYNANVDVKNLNQVDFYKKEASSLFDNGDTKHSNYKWAKLVQHRNLFSSPKNHKLTAGTVIKYKDEDRFLICIQQRCDSVRIDKEEARSFLFLPLQQNGKGEAVVVEENTHLIVDNKSYSIELHKFKPIGTDVQILAKPQNDQYVFTDIENKQYIWVAELKDMFAQHIVSNYASQLSRVGIDNSEWIRLVGKLGK